jgi:hypothetical protein
MKMMNIMMNRMPIAKNPNCMTVGHRVPAAQAGTPR